ncbi:MAG: abortive infection protein [Chloroflexota bacterium]
MERRGVNYDVGIQFHEDYLSRTTFDAAVVHRELEIIKQDLHCNAVRISGTDIDRLITAAKDALDQGLEVWLSPHLHDKNPQETLEYTVRCAAAAETLRKTSPRLVFIVGCELTLFMQGILKGDNFMERLGSPLSVWWNLKILKAHNKPLNTYLTKLNKAVREVFHGQVTYASAPIEAVDWRLFDFVCLDYYRAKANRDSYAERLQRHFRHGKPVIITEVGCCAYQGAEDKGARGFMIVDPVHRDQINGDYVRDEGLQARELIDLLGLLQKSDVGGTFVFTFVAPNLPYNENPRCDLDMASYALAKTLTHKHGLTYPDMPWEPKLAFHVVADFYAKQ